mmetsp:Transcript_4819/g.22062  ORF Transcript_4819/g.22062 Transcript_4819/m.22062 type:complete len:201 (-) Transcript_4819:19-621(-)
MVHVSSVHGDVHVRRRDRGRRLGRRVPRAPAIPPDDSALLEQPAGCVVLVVLVVRRVRRGDAPAGSARPAVAAVATLRAVPAVAREGHLEDVHGLRDERGGATGDGERHRLDGREREATRRGTVGGCDETLLGGVRAIRGHDDHGALLARLLPDGKRRHGLGTHRAGPSSGRDAALGRCEGRASEAGHVRRFTRCLPPLT